MKTLIQAKTLIVIFLLFSFRAFMYAQTIYTVNNNPGTSADFTDLQVAINAASNGDILYVQQSTTSYGNITIDRELTLVGRSHSDSPYRTPLGNITLDTGASNTTIKGFQFGSLSESSSAGSTINNLVVNDNFIDHYSFGIDLIFNNVLIQGNIIGQGADKIIGPNTSNVLIVNNIYQNIEGGGLRLRFQMASSLILDNNIFRSFTELEIWNESGDALTINNSMFINSRLTSNNNLPFYLINGAFIVNNSFVFFTRGSNNNIYFSGPSITLNNITYNVDPVFKTVSDFYNSVDFSRLTNDLTLQGGSPAEGAGLGGEDIGIYANYDFNMLGTPNSLPDLKVISHNPTVPKNGNLTVTIKAKTN